MVESPEVTAAIVGGTFTVVGALIASATAALIGKKFSKQAALKEELNRAVQDLQFLLAVERRHCDLHKQTCGQSNKNRIRSEVLRESGLKWSGKFTPGRASQVGGK